MDFQVHCPDCFSFFLHFHCSLQRIQEALHVLWPLYTLPRCALTMFIAALVLLQTQLQTFCSYLVRTSQQYFLIFDSELWPVIDYVELWLAAFSSCSVSRQERRSLNFEFARLLSFRHFFGLKHRLRTVDLSSISSLFLQEEDRAIFLVQHSYLRMFCHHVAVYFVVSAFICYEIR